MKYRYFRPTLIKAGNTWYPEGQDAQDYSPLRKLREKGKIYIGGDKYTGRSSENEEQQKIYDNFTDHAYKLSNARRQLLDLFVNNAAQKSTFNRFRFNNDDNDKIAGDYKQKVLKLNTNSKENPAKIANHEFMHWYSDVNRPKWSEIDKSTNDLLPFMKTHFPPPERPHDLSGPEKMNWKAIIDQVDLDKRTKMLQEAQDIIDPTTNFSANYPAKNFSWKNNFDHDFEQRVARNEVETGFTPDEFVAHFMERFDKPLKLTDNNLAKEFVKQVVNYSHNAINDLGGTSANYPDLISQLQNRKTELEQPLLSGGLGLGSSQIQQQNPFNQQHPFGSSGIGVSQQNRPGANVQAYLNNLGPIGQIPYNHQNPRIRLHDRIAPYNQGIGEKYRSKSSIKPPLFNTQQLDPFYNQTQHNTGQQILLPDYLEGSNPYSDQNLYQQQIQNRASSSAQQRQYDPDNPYGLATGGSVGSSYDPYLNTGSASSGLGSLYDSLRRYASGGEVGLGGMGRFFGFYR